MSWNDKLSATRKGLRTLNGAIPDTSAAFGALGKSVKEGGTLDPLRALYHVARIRIDPRRSDPRRGLGRARDGDPDGGRPCDDVCGQGA